METKTTQAAPANASEPSEADILKALEGVSVDALIDSNATPQDPGIREPMAEALPADPRESVEAAGTVENQAPKQETAPPKESKPDDRASKTWEEINREKAELERQRLEIARQRQDFEQRKAEILPEAQRAKATAEDYDRMASEWAAEGKDQLAAAAKERAALLRSTAARTEAEAREAQLRTQQNAVMREVLSAHPELQNRDSDLHKEVAAVMKARPVLASYPDGIRDAVEVARLRLETRSTEALRKEVAELKQKLTEREKLLQPGTGAPSVASGSSGTDFDSLSSEEREKRILKELRSAESRGVEAWVS